MAPEMLALNANSPHRDYTNAVDIWATGCIVYRLVTGNVPFGDDTELREYCNNRYLFPLDQLYDERIKSGGIRFIQALLATAPNERASAIQALEHEWIKTESKPTRPPSVIASSSEPITARIADLTVSEDGYETVTHEAFKSVAPASSAHEDSQSSSRSLPSAHSPLLRTSTRSQPQPSLSLPSPPSDPIEARPSPSAGKMTLAQLQRALSDRSPTADQFRRPPPIASAFPRSQESSVRSAQSFSPGNSSQPPTESPPYDLIPNFRNEGPYDPNEHLYTSPAFFLKAAQDGDTERVKKCLTVARVTVKVYDKMNRTALHLAAMNRHLTTVGLLLEKGAIVDALDRKLCTPLHLACAFQNDPSAYVVDKLLSYGAQVDVVNSHGFTPLYLAYENRNDYACAALAEFGADPSTTRKKQKPSVRARVGGFFHTVIDNPLGHSNRSALATDLRDDEGNLSPYIPSARLTQD